MKVLYVDHTALVGGGERSLLGLLDALPGEVHPRLACPAGPLQQRARQQGVSTATIAETAASLKVHPIHTPLALGAMARASAGLYRAARAYRADLLHANSIRAGLIAAPVARACGVPLVLHVRDSLPPSGFTRRLQSTLAAHADATIAISHHVARAFDSDGRARRLVVIDNPFDLARFDPRLVDRDDARASLGLANGAPVLSLIGQITPWKGQEEAIRALAIVRQRHAGTILLLVGETKFIARATRHDNRAYLQQLHTTVAELGLQDAVRFLGEREDVPEVLRASDVALTPSWEEPFGRAVVEAMAMGVPTVATAVGGPSEVISDGVDGLLVAPRRPETWAATIERLLDDPEGRRSIGAAARQTALDRFGKERHAAEILALYRQILDHPVSQNATD